MPTQTRATLKGYFTKGSIPTENNFADLVDSTLVQIDDGLLTSATAPLSIKAVGADEGLINFYRVESGQNPNTTTWQIKHLPVGSSTPGLSIGTPAATRLFIDNTTGNVGIGTVTPGFPLTIEQHLRRQDQFVGPVRKPLWFRHSRLSAPDPHRWSQRRCCVRLR